MAEYIEKSDALGVLEHCAIWNKGINAAYDEMQVVPAADVMEVVRCRYCKHWLKDVAGCTDFVGRCEFANYMVGAAGYCSYGERKDGDVV